MTGPVLQARHVSRTYGEVVPVPAVVDVSVDIQPGQLTVIAGPSGSGKSTLLGLLGLLDVPTDGEILIDGRLASGLDDAGRSKMRADAIGFVFQQFNLIADQDAATNVETALLYRGLDRRERRKRAHQALGAVGLADRTRHRPSQLSGGEQQRVAIARAAVSRPRVILADEPTGNLDTDTSDRVVALLQGLVDDGTAVVVVTHDPAVVDRADREFRLRDGRLETQPS